MALKTSLNYTSKGLFYNPHLVLNQFRINEKHSIVNFPVDAKQDKNNKELANIIYKTKEKEDVLMIVIPSLSLPKNCLKDIKGIAHYEIRSLWHILLAREKNLKVLFLSSIDFPKEAVIHLLEARGNRHLWEDRIEFLKIDGDEKNCLSENILNSSNALQLIKKKVLPKKTFLMSFIASSSEEKIANKLNIPYYGVKEIYQFYQTKSGNREIFKEAGVSYPDGFENLTTEFDIIQAIENLKINHPDSKKMVVKLDHGVSGKGNALFTLDISQKIFFKLEQQDRYKIIKTQLNKMKYQVEGMTWEIFLKMISKGAIVELFVEGKEKFSPSCQVVIRPNGKIDILSTHEQILDQSGMVFLGCEFPAKKEYRNKLHKEALLIGKKLALKGIIGFFGIDFLVTKKKDIYETFIIEINLRQGGTTHPYQTARLLTDSTYTSTGHLIDKNGDFVFYLSNDNFISENLKEKSFASLISYMKKENVLFNQKSLEGVTFHLSSTLKPFGKIGYIVIGKSEKRIKEMRENIDKLLLNFS